MQQPTTYTLTFTPNERDALIFALGNTYKNVREGTGMFLSPADFLAMSQRIMHARPDAQAARQMSGTAAASAIAAPAKPTDPPANPDTRGRSEPPRIRWAHDKDGNEAPNPEGCREIRVEIWKIEDKPPRTAPARPRQKITWQASNGRGYADAFCWDPKLFPFLALRIKQPARLFVTSSADGKYTNVVGIEA